MQFITDFADTALTLPLAFGFGVMLALSGWQRGALAWAAGVGLALGITLVAKLALLPCGPVVLGEAVRSPSGHTAAASVVYGTLVGMFLPQGAPRVLLTGLFAALVAAIIAATRLGLSYHNWAEVLVGAVIGIGSAVLIAWLAGPSPAGLLERAWRGRAVAITLLVAVALHGSHLPAEAMISRVAGALGGFGVCADRTESVGIRSVYL